MPMSASAAPPEMSPRYAHMALAVGDLLVAWLVDSLGHSFVSPSFQIEAAGAPVDFRRRCPMATSIDSGRSRYQPAYAQAVCSAAGINRRPPRADDVSSPCASRCRAIAGGPCTRRPLTGPHIRGRRQPALARTQPEVPDTRLEAPRTRPGPLRRRRLAALHTQERAAPNGGDPAWRNRPHDQAAP